MIQKFSGLVFTLLLSIQAFAVGDDWTVGAQQGAVGISAVSLVNVFSAGNNQAGTAYIEKPSVGIFYANSFALKGLNNFSLVAAIPIKKAGTFGLDIDYFGYSAYNEKKIGLSYSMKLMEELSIGVQLDYINSKFGGGYGSKNFFTFEFGLLAKPFKELTIGAHVYNPLPLKVDDATGEKLPTVLKLGLTYNIKDVVWITSEAEKDIRDAFVFRAGIDYKPVDFLNIRAGISTTPLMGTFGLGFNFSGLQLDIASAYHPQLGFSPQAGLSYGFGKKENK